MGKREILTYLLESNLSISAVQITVSVLMALLLGLLIYFVYRVTYTGTAYSANFGQSLVYMAVITTVVMTTIQSNLALSLGMVGSLSIIRFRTAVKEPRDIMFLFWSISVGISCGAAVFVPGLLGSAVIAVLAFVFSRFVYERDTYLVVVETAALPGVEGKVTQLLSARSKRFKMKMGVVSPEKQEATYEINLKKEAVQPLLEELKQQEGVRQVNIVSYSGELLG